MIVTDPVPAAKAETAVALLPVVETVGQPLTVAEPVGLKALAMIPAPLTVLTAPVLTVLLPLKACAATPKPPGVVPPLVEVVMLPAVTEAVPPLARIPRSPVTTLPTTMVLVPLLEAIVRSPRPFALILPATMEMLPVCALAPIAVLVAPVVVMSPVRSVRSVPPAENTPNELVPLVMTLPTVTVAVWPTVLSVNALAPAPPRVVRFTGAPVPVGVKVSAPPVEVNVAAGTAVVVIGPVAT